MTYDHIEYTVEEDELRAVIALDRPEKRNALSSPLLAELEDALEDAEENDAVRAVILRGNGPAFSAGYDMGESGDSDSVGDGSDSAGNDPDSVGDGSDSGGYGSGESGDDEDPVPSVDDLLDRMETITSHLYTIWQLNKPVIAAVHGYCLAGASDLALVCDIVIAAEDVKFGYPGQRMAGHPPTLTYPFFMDVHHAKELLYTGKIIDGERAREMGLFNRVVPRDELLETAHDEVDAIAKVPSGGVRIQKHSLNSVVEQQGFRATLKNSEFLDPLAHLTDVSRQYYEMEDMEQRLQWMNETDKAMRDTVDRADDAD